MSNASEVKAAFNGTASPWNTAIDVNAANNELLLMSFPDGVKEASENLSDPVLGTSFLEDSYAGNRIVDATLEQKFRWAGRHLKLLSMVCGSDTVTDLAPIAGSQYAHNIDAEDFQGAFKYGTLVIDDGAGGSPM